VAAEKAEATEGLRYLLFAYVQLLGFQPVPVVSGQGKPANWWFLQPGVNKFNNTFATETAMYRTSDGGSLRKTNP